MSDNDGHTRIKPTEEATRLKPSNTEEEATRLKSSPSHDEKTQLQPTRPSFNTRSNQDHKVNSSDETVLNSDVGKHTSNQAWVDDARSEPFYASNVSVGETLNNRFLLERVLGSGGMGEVYAAQDKRRVEMKDEDTYVALKLLREEFRSHTKFMMALQRESKKVQQLSHPNIVTVYDFDRDGDAAYISMEYLRGQSLDRVVFPKSLTTKEALYVIDRMARGLAYAHQEGYVHADFKPANVFLTEEKQVKILDFGIAQAVIKDKQGYKSVEITDEDDPTLYGLTPNYASIEMLAGENPLPSDDVYSLCCVAYELLTGKHPFTDKNGKRITAARAKTLGMTPSLIEGIPKEFARALRKGLSYSREERFQNAGEFIDATKPIITRKQIALIVLFSLISTFAYFAFDTWQTTKVPSLNSLQGSLVDSANMVREADSIYEEGDIDFAHRLYAQAWDAAGDIKDPSLELDKLKRIIDHRMNRIADQLISESEKENLDEFRLQQIQIALEFIKNDDLGTRDKKIERALKALREKETLTN